MLRLNRQRKYRLIVLIFVLLTILSCSKQETSRAQDSERSLEELRHDLAMRYMDAAPHVALAKYFRDHGNRLLAFYVMETARRYRFDETEFNQAFRSVFGGEKPVDSSQAAEAALLKEHAGAPDSFETAVKLADIYIARHEWPKAKEYILKAIRLKPDDYESTDALSIVLSQEGNNEESVRVVREYARNYPETLNGYRLRIDEVLEKAPGKAKPLVLEAIKKFPQEGAFVLYLGNILHRENKLKEAEQQYVKAAELSPGSPFVQSWVGRFFHKAQNDDRRALEYYLNAYFLDPHAYETEFVESRIQKINAALSAAEYERQAKSGLPPSKIVADPNPLIASQAIEEMAKKWDPAQLKTYLELMGHDDGGVRWYATMAIAANVDRSFDATLKELLRDKDLRKRGLAAYIAAQLWKQESFDTLRAMLREEAQLLRFDAISALILHGGPEGRKIVLEHLANEPHPKLKKLIESAARRESGAPE